MINQSRRPLKFFHILIAGFTQRQGTYGNGIDGIYRDLHWKFHKYDDTVIWYFPWYCDIKGTAEFISRSAAKLYRIDKSRPRIQLAGYSFGGQTSVDLAHELLARNSIKIDRMTLCDAVRRRSRSAFGWLSAANPFAKIKLPNNIDAATAFVQTHRRFRLTRRLFYPRGHRIVVAEGVNFSGPHELPSEHTHIDNSVEFMDQVMEDAEFIHT